MSPFVPFDDRNDERRKACGRVGNPDYDTLLVFDTAQVLGSATVRKNVSGVLTTRGHILLGQRLSQIYLHVSK
eukprot:7986312-Alexandrium_andersonii.AAC.1